MAVAAPGATFLGIDLSARQIETGEARRAALGLTNVTLRVADVAAFDAGAGTFDYVIAHGLYSWVPEPVAEAILALIGRLLAPGGVAFVSYNTYPGWHLRGLVRDLLVRNTAGAGSPAERIARARDLLGFVTANAQDRNRAYGGALRDASSAVLALRRRAPLPRVAGARDNRPSGSSTSPPGPPGTAWCRSPTPGSRRCRWGA